MKKTMTAFIAMAIMSVTSQSGAFENKDKLLIGKANSFMAQGEAESLIARLDEKERVALDRTLSWIQLTKESKPQLLNVSERKVYLACDPVGVQLIVGFIYSKCIVVGVNQDKSIEFLGATVKQGRLGVGGMISLGSISSERVTRENIASSTIELKGVQDLRDVKGWHVGGSIGYCAGGEVVVAQSGLNGKVTGKLDAQVSTSVGCHFSALVSKITAEKRVLEFRLDQE